jgi:hypothetical protein
MKNLIYLSVLLLMVACGQSDAVPIEPPNPEQGDGISWLTNVLMVINDYWAALLPILWAVVRLTPTKKDNDILAMIIKWLGWLVPNKKKGGGTHDQK